MINAFTQLPFRSNASEYEEVCRQVVEAAKGNPDVAALYLLGSEWVPGVSDLDIVAVHKTGDRPLPSPWDLSEESKRIFTHRYITILEKDFRDFYFLFPEIVTDLRLLSGEPISLRRPSEILSESELRMLLATNLIDILINKLLTLPHADKTLKAGRGEVRPLIGTLFSLTYTSSMLAAITGNSLSGEFLPKIAHLRSSWFERKEEESLRLLENLLEKGIEVALEAASTLDRHLVAQGVQGGALHFTNRKYSIHAVSEWNIDRYHREFKSKRSLVGKGQFFSFPIPASFAPFLAAKGEGAASWNRLFRGSLSPMRGMPLLSGNGVREHVRAAGNMFESMIASNGFTRPSFAYGFGLKDVERPLISRAVGLINRYSL